MRFLFILYLKAKLELSENEKTCSGKLDKTSKLPQPMFSNVEVDLYKPVYDSMPPFPIASFEGIFMPQH